MLWFLDAGDDETIGTLSWPASKKRQGTKSREVGHRLGSGHYGDLNRTFRCLCRFGRLRHAYLRRAVLNSYDLLQRTATACPRLKHAQTWEWKEATSTEKETENGDDARQDEA